MIEGPCGLPRERLGGPLRSRTRTQKEWRVKTATTWQEAPRIDGAKVAVLRSSMYAEIVDAMATKCVSALNELGCNSVTQHEVPGCLEMPLAAQDLLDQTIPPDAIVCLGVILKGETLHFEMISYEVMRGLGTLALQARTPIIIEVLSVFKIKDALDRSGNDKFNKGLEGAVAAARFIDWRRQLTTA